MGTVPQELEIEAATLAGEGIGHVGELEVRVSGAFPGDRVRVQPGPRSRQHPRMHGHLLEVVRPGAQRRTAPCPQQESREGRCTGCPLMPLQLRAQRSLKRAALRDLGLALEALHGDDRELDYRWSSKRVAFGRPGALRLGSFVRGSHRTAVMTGCRVDHPLITAAADELERAAQRLGIAPYDERRGRGDLRYVWLKTDGERVLVTLVTAGEHSRAARDLPDVLQQPAGLAWSVQSGAGNALRGSAARPLKGATQLTVPVAGVAVEVGPLGFLQPNVPLMARAYRELVGEARGRLALDLYAGSGVTTALLRERFDQVHPCEAYPESAARLGVAPQAAEPFLQQWAQPDSSPDLVVANPPRSGLGDGVCAALKRVAARRIHIMSCGPQGLARDLERLCAGADAPYRTVHLAGYDSLPQTPHVELVAHLERR